MKSRQKEQRVVKRMSTGRKLTKSPQHIHNLFSGAHVCVCVERPPVLYPFVSHEAAQGTSCPVRKQQIISVFMYFIDSSYDRSWCFDACAQIEKLIIKDLPEFFEIFICKSGTTSKNLRNKLFIKWSEFIFHSHRVKFIKLHRPMDQLKPANRSAGVTWAGRSGNEGSVGPGRWTNVPVFHPRQLAANLAPRDYFN